jgi:predicted DNA-binding transcriptional regulator AlpA
MNFFDESVPRLLNTEQVAELLGIKPHTLAVARCDSTSSLAQIPYIKIGRSVRYRLADIEAFLEDHMVGVPA